MTTQSEQIDVTPIMKANGTFDYWQMSVNKGAPLGPGHYPPIAVTQGNNADFSITILGSQSITFSNDPIWVQPGTAKPTGGVDKEIHKLSGQGTTVLTFKDHNWKKNDLNYVLNFNGAPQLDPIIDNGGGGPPIYMSYAFYVVGAIALLAIVALIFAKRGR